MGKLPNEKAYDAGYKAGREGDFLSDTASSVASAAGNLLPDFDDEDSKAYKSSYKAGFNDGYSDRGDKKNSHYQGGKYNKKYPERVPQDDDKDDRDNEPSPQKDPPPHNDPGSDDGENFLGKIIGFVVGIIIIIWLISNVIIPLIFINAAIIALIVALKKHRNKIFLFISFLGAVLIVFDYNKGLSTKTLADSVHFFAKWIPAFFYINLAAGLTSAYFLIRDMVNVRTIPATDEEFSKRNLMIIGSLFLAGLIAVVIPKLFSNSTSVDLSPGTPVITTSSIPVSGRTTTQQKTLPVIPTVVTPEKKQYENLTTPDRSTSDSTINEDQTTNKKIVSEEPTSKSTPAKNFSEYYPDGHLKTQVEFSHNGHEQTKRTYYDDLQIASESYWKDSAKEGQWMEWFPNGHERSMVHYANNKKNGLATWYDQSSWADDGTTIERCNFFNDEPDGKYSWWLSKSNPYAQGQSRIKVYTRNQAQACHVEGNFTNGIVQGEAKYWEVPASGPPDNTKYCSITWDHGSVLASTFAYIDPNFAKAKDVPAYNAGGTTAKNNNSPVTMISGIIDGKWTGLITQGRQTFDVELTCDYEKNEFTIHYPLQFCSGNWTIERSTDRSIDFREQIVKGKFFCASGTTVRVTVINENQLQCDFYNQKRKVPEAHGTINRK